jgi:hypothetical protein
VETIGDAIAVAIANGAQIIQNVQFITSPNSGLASLRPLVRRPPDTCVWCVSRNCRQREAVLLAGAVPGPGRRDYPGEGDHG